jgi:hypothetical protein
MKTYYATATMENVKRHQIKLGDHEPIKAGSPAVAVAKAARLAEKDWKKHKRGKQMTGISIHVTIYR